MDSGEHVSNKPCFFCTKGGDDIHYYYGENLVMYCECPYCGSYKISHDAVARLKENKDDVFFNKARSIAATRKLQGRDNYTLSLGRDYSTIMIGDSIFLDEYPSNFPERIRKALWNIGKLTDFDPLESCVIDRNNVQYLFCNNGEKASKILKFMEQQEYINFAEGDHCYHIHLTLTGYNSIQKNDSNDQCFIAMWFDKSTELYRTVIKRAIKNAGYQPCIADEELHNDQIMPKVLNDIKKSRFIIADLSSSNPANEENSGVRGGVYFEAGYAKGIGLPVILTCRDDDKSRIHFDLKQNMCYFWSEEDGNLKSGNLDFADIITQNILLNIGPGPCKKQ